MKKNYLKLLLGVLFCLCVQISMGQSVLQKSKYGNIISEYINGSGKVLKKSTSDLEDIYVNKELFSEKTGVANVYLNQRYQGIKIFNAVSTVGIKNDKVFHFANRFKSDLSNKINTATATISAGEAINSVAQHFRLGNVSNVELIEQKGNNYIFSKGTISQENIPVEKVYFEDKDGLLKLAWDLNMGTIDDKHWWSVRVDATSGDILDIDDWILSCDFGGNHAEHGVHKKGFSNKDNAFSLFGNMSLVADGSQYNVYALPTESPNHGPRTLVSNPADVTASPYGWHDDDGVDGAEYTITKGNNVHAYEDRLDANVAIYSPDGTGSLSFNFPIDFNDYPEDYEDAAITQLFYASNMMHDIWYNYGFDESSGNFQETNYTGQGAGGDSVNAEAQDGGGRNNATWTSSLEGSSPRMQMYLWDDPNGTNFIVHNGALAGNYFGISASFGPDLTTTPITADLWVLEDDNAGSSTDPNDACDTVTNAADLNGKIVIVSEPGCEYGSKVLAAQNAGAVAVIVVSASGSPSGMAGGTDGGSVTIPSMMIDQFEGEALMASALYRGVSASLVFPNSIDNSFNNTTIAHEYGHGISTRLTGGAFTNCLTSCAETDSEGNCIKRTEQMGEGWSDWFSLMVTMTSSDLGTDGRGYGTYNLGEDVDGDGIRPEKYSTDFAINSYTYVNTNSAGLSAPHGVGFVWCTMLWDLTWAYIDKYGFDSDIHNGTGGNNKVMQLVIDGLKLQPCNPGFVDGRDALLAADFAETGGENQCLIWEVFAKRGLGFGADQGDSMSRTDQVESFVEPNQSDVTGAGLPTLANCTTLSDTDFNSDDYKVYPNPTTAKIIIRTTKNLGDAVLTLTDINGRIVYSKKATLLGETEVNMNTLQSGMYILNIKGEFIDTNEKVIKN